MTSREIKASVEDIKKTLKTFETIEKDGEFLEDIQWLSEIIDALQDENANPNEPLYRLWQQI